MSANLSQRVCKLGEMLPDSDCFVGRIGTLWSMRYGPSITLVIDVYTGLRSSPEESFWHLLGLRFVLLLLATWLPERVLGQSFMAQFNVSFLSGVSDSSWCGGTIHWTAIFFATLSLHGFVCNIDITLLPFKWTFTFCIMLCEVFLHFENSRTSMVVIHSSFKRSCPLLFLRALLFEFRTKPRQNHVVNGRARRVSTFCSGGVSEVSPSASDW